MEVSSPFIEQARLLVRLLPSVAKQDCFALKGGTAINLFLRDMPRLSVDIDLAYLPIEDREVSLDAVDKALGEISVDIEQHIPHIKIHASVLRGTDSRVKLVVLQNSASIKIEVTPVLRGSVYPPEPQELSDRATEIFGYAKTSVLSFEDLYAGKICAALDRQHPRDLYDVYWLLENEGISERLKNAFLVYLMGHNRPMVELLSPQAQEMEALHHEELEGMSYEPIDFEQIRQTLPRLVTQIHSVMSDSDRYFLIDLKRGIQDWRKFVLPEVEHLPSIRWKMLNLEQMKPSTRKAALEKLEKVLFG